MAVTQLRSGNAGSAFDELENIAATDAGITADMAIVAAHMQRSEFDKALKAVDGLDKKLAGKPMPAQLRGQIQLAKRDTAGARQSFERALTIDPAFFPAISALASMDLSDNKPEVARKRFDDLLAKEPKNGRACWRWRNWKAREGAPKDELADLIGSRGGQPHGTHAELLLIDFHLRNKDAKQALSAAQSAVAAMPENAELLGRAGPRAIGIERTQPGLGHLRQVGQPAACIAAAALAHGQCAHGRQKTRRRAA